MLGLDPLVRPGPDLGRQGLGQILGKSQRLSDVADGAPRAVADHGGAESGAVPPVGVEDPLHHDLAALVLEIDVDVGRLAALFGNEALEQEVVAFGVDRGDAQDVADSGVRRRSPALAQDVLAARERDDRVHGQEIGSVTEASDQTEFVAEKSCDLVRNTLRIPAQRPLECQLLEGLLRRPARLGDFVGILVLQLFQREAAAFGDVQGSR